MINQPASDLSTGETLLMSQFRLPSVMLMLEIVSPAEKYEWKVFQR